LDIGIISYLCDLSARLDALALTIEDLTKRQALKAIIVDIQARADTLEEIFKIETRPQIPL